MGFRLIMIFPYLSLAIEHRGWKMNAPVVLPVCAIKPMDFE